MRRLTFRSSMSIMVIVTLLMTMLPVQAVFAAATRTPEPPSDATSSAISVEGESGTYANGARTADDHAYSGTGFAVLDGGSANAKVTYNVSVQDEGTYDFAFNYIAGPVSGWNNDRSINLYVNGQKVKTITFPGTSSWDDWQYFKTSVQFAAGDNTITLETNGTQNGICIDYLYYWFSQNQAAVQSIQFQPQQVNVDVGSTTPTTVIAKYDNDGTGKLDKGVAYASKDDTIASIDSDGTVTGVKGGTTVVSATYGSYQASATVDVTDANTVPSNATVYQAEDGSLSGGANVATNHTGYTGTGFVAGYDGSSTAKTTFTVNVKNGGDYNIGLRYSAGEVNGWPTDRTVGLIVNDGNTSNITLKGTGTWEDWADSIQTVNLKPGSNTIAITALTSNDNSDVINLDKLALWTNSSNPTVYTIRFDQQNYTVNDNDNVVQTKLYDVKTDEKLYPSETKVTYSSSDTSIATVDDSGKVTGIKAGKVTITAKSDDYSATTTVQVLETPTVTVDFSKPTTKVDPSMFGYILTPNYDVPNSRMTLLGPIINRETIPVQNFQAVSDGNKDQYNNESSVLPRLLDAYKHAKDNGLKWYMLLGMHPSWTMPSKGPWGGAPTSMPEFKQYIKDVLQYLRDNGATPDFADLTNESWTGNEETYKAVWEAVREVYPEFVPAVGPGAIGINGAPDLYIPFASKNKLTVEGPSWHEFWTDNTYAPLSQQQSWVNQVSGYQKQYPQANGKYIIWEENNAGSTNPTDWTRSMANVIRVGITQNIKGCLQNYNWNGMSDLLKIDKKAQNAAQRTSMWWVYYMFSQMSGDYVNVSTNVGEDFTATASKDTNESKIIIAKNNVDGPVYLNLQNQPYSGQNIKVDFYKITNTENNGLQYQFSATPASTSNLKLEIPNAAANETWFAIVKKVSTDQPSFLHQMTPDDGEVAASTPTFTWSPSQGATSYTVIVSANKDLSNPVIQESGITDTKYTVSNALNNGATYYWTVKAVNANGSTAASHHAVYQFIVGNPDVPGQFGPYLPSINAQNVSTQPEFDWSPAYNATSYRLVVSKNKDLSNPVLNVSGITNIRDTAQFGPNSQAYYQPTTALENDTPYYWKVFAVNDSGERPMNGPLNTFTTKIPGDAPATFNLLGPATGTLDVSTRAVLTWQTSKNAFFYKLEVSPNADMSNPVIVRDRMIYTKYTVEPNLLKSGTPYYWRVTAYSQDLSKSQPASNGIHMFTTEAVPSAPLLYAEYATGNNVTLWFDESSGATSYKIKYGTEPGQLNQTITDVTSSPYEIKNLPPGTYYFSVVATNQFGDSSIWNERSVTVSGS
ncbi:CBM35 domain-containing protein [Paenibacillus wenxiniae]|uniref:CBM35 domain-containing protein n=1 Tax=Paenibacillus wenxiniae TaxID=1636843 RepID=A0ABW4RKR2_9BACL